MISPLRCGILALALCTASLPMASAQVPPGTPAELVPGPEPADPALRPVTARRGFLPGQPQFWESMHQENLATAKAHRGPVPVVLLGDSITANWGKRPTLPIPENVAVWDRHFPNAPFLNFGIGGDTTQNVLWRIEHGELDGLLPRLIVLAIGVNNTWDPVVPPAAVAEGVKKCVSALRSKFPEAKILVIKPLPVGHTPDNPLRSRVNAIREAIAAVPWTEQPGVFFADPGPGFLQPDGSILKTIMDDGVHPGMEGYEIYAKGIKPIVKDLLK